MLFDRNAFERGYNWARIAGLAALLLAASTGRSAGQAHWQQTVQAIAPVEEEGPARSLLRSIISAAEERGAEVRRAPEAAGTSLSRIRDTLSAEGLSPSSATHVFIRYTFTYSGSSLREEIRDLHFIYRPQMSQEEDIPILYVNLDEQPFVAELISNQGTALASNESAVRPFRAQLKFHALRDTLTVVRVGNRIVRDPEQARKEKERILKITRELTYN